MITKQIHLRRTQEIYIHQQIIDGEKEKICLTFTELNRIMEIYFNNELYYNEQ